MSPPVARSIRTFSLRAHLLLLVIGTMLPALVVAALLVRRVVADNRGAVEQQLLGAARAEAAIVDAELGGTIRALQGLAESDRLTTGDIPAFYSQAQHFKSTQPTWSAIALSMPDGLQFVNTGRPFGEPLPFVTDRDSFDRAVETKLPAVGNLRVGQITDQLGFPVRVPVVRDGRVVYVVSAWITSASFGEMLRRQALLSDVWVSGVLDTNGVVVARSRDADRFVGQKGTPVSLPHYQAEDQGVYRDVALDGVPVYRAFSRAIASRWIAGVAVPVSVVDATFQQTMTALAAVAVFLLAIGGGGTYLISRRISHDISKSTAEAEAIAGGLRPSQ